MRKLVIAGILALCIVCTSCATNSNSKAVSGLSSTDSVLSAESLPEISSVPKTVSVVESGALSVASSSKNSSLKKAAAVKSSATRTALSQTRSSVSKAASKAASVSPLARPSTAVIPRSDISGGLFMPEPQFLDYNHRLYMFTRDYTEPDKLIGYHKFNEVSPDSYKVCSVKGTDVSQSICEEDYNSKADSKNSSFWKYDYICNDTITVNGTVYDLTGGRDGKMIQNGQSAGIWPKFAVTSDHTFSLAQGTGGKGNEYYFFNCLINNITKITDKVIGKLSTGTIYSIDEVDPSRLIALNLNGRWFVAEKKDNNGYNGKTITDILKDKGLYPARSATVSGIVPTDNIY